MEMRRWAAERSEREIRSAQLMRSWRMWSGGVARARGSRTPTFGGEGLWSSSSSSTDSSS